MVKWGIQNSFLVLAWSKFNNGIIGLHTQTLSMPRWSRASVQVPMPENSGSNFGQRTEWSLIYFFINAYLNILAQSQILVISLYVICILAEICIKNQNIEGLSKGQSDFFHRQKIEEISCSVIHLLIRHLPSTNVVQVPTNISSVVEF